MMIVERIGMPRLGLVVPRRLRWWSVPLLLLLLDVCPDYVVSMDGRVWRE